MQITFLGVGFLVATVLAVVTNRRQWLTPVLSASMPLMQLPAIVLPGGDRVPSFFLAAFAAFGWVLADALRGKPQRFLGWAALVGAVFTLGAVLLPVVFADTPVLIPREGIDSQVMDPGKLTLTISNFAQAVYFLLGLAVIVFIANNPPNGLHFLSVGFGIGTAFTVWTMASTYLGIYFPSDLLGASGQESYFGGTQRLSGIFSEPSYLATFSLPAAAYFAFLTSRIRDGRIWAALAVLVNSAAIHLSFSGTSVAGLLMLLGVMATVYGVAFLAGRTGLNPNAALLGVLGFCALLIASPMVKERFGRIIEGKLSSTSGVNRQASNEFSIDLLGETYLLGAGLGSSRPSSYFFMLISNVGVIGVVLFSAMVVAMLRNAIPRFEYRPEVWAFVSVLICKLVAEPNPTSPVMILTLAACAVAPSPVAAPAKTAAPPVGIGPPVSRLSHAPQVSRSGRP